jgi:hypothetical protein
MANLLMFKILDANNEGDNLPAATLRDRIRFLGDMTWGFEELTDMDDNDVIVKANFS